MASMAGLRVFRHFDIFSILFRTISARGTPRLVLAAGSPRENFLV